VLSEGAAAEGDGHARGCFERPMREAENAAADLVVVHVAEAEEPFDHADAILNRRFHGVADATGHGLDIFLGWLRLGNGQRAQQLAS